MIKFGVGKGGEGKMEKLQGSDYTCASVNQI